MGCFSSTPQEGGSAKGSSGSSKLDNYTQESVLGQGGSCKVLRGKRKSDGLKVAIKEMKNPGPRGINKKLYDQERHILDIVKGNPNIIHLVESFQTPEHFYIITKLAEGGELFDRIANTKEYGSFTEKRASRLIKTMLECLQYIHDKNIVHRDLKPENFVFTSKKEDAEMILIDFGCALEVEDKTVYKDLVGTPYYLAPESAAKRCQRTGAILKKSDLWAVGVIAYIMLTGTPPFKGRRHADILADILTKPVSFPENREKLKLSKGFKDFVKKALKKPPGRRMTVEDALKHKWVTGDAAAENTVHSEVLKCLKQYTYQTKLKKQVAKLLADNMGAEPRQKIREHFTELDKSGDGYLDLDELEILLTTLPGTTKEDAKEEAKKMMKEADMGDDNRIDFEEFATIWQRKLLSVNDKYIAAVFKVLDSDGDHYITIDELSSVFEGVSHEAIVGMMTEVDTNKDNKISFKEFKEAMKEKVDRNNLNQNMFSSSKVHMSEQLDKDIGDVDDE